MGKSVLSTLIVKLIGDIKGFEDSTTKAQQAAKKMQSGIADGFQAMTGVSLTTAGGFAAVGAALKHSIDQALESEQVMAATEAVLASTGRSAETTAAEIEKLAMSQSRLTAIDDETVQSGLNVLLGYKQISEDMLPRAALAMEDMAAAQSKGNLANIDLASSATQVGKALAAPERAAALLFRAGIVLTAQQKEQISTFLDMNDTAGAQGVILDALGTKYGGMAEALGNTNAGKMQKAKNDIANLGETIGGILIPILGDAAAALDTLMTGEGVITDAFQEHNQVMMDSAGTYEEYRNEMLRAAEAAGYSVDMTTAEMYGMGAATDEMATKVGILTENEWNMNAAAAASPAAIDAMGASMAIAAAPAGALATMIGNQEAALGIVMGSMKELTQEMLFQQAAKGLDADAALRLGQDMGLIDDHTFAVLSTLELVRQKYDENKDGLIDAKEAAFDYVAEVEN
ncbi:MAG TPA: hypothetical protein VFF78_04675, partial [Anaerolineaceae bacterium]|nr:hypothetical protein [Anaerolineaceae bacterium]